MPNSKPYEINVLYVEDKHLNQKIAELILHSLDCKVDIADNGAEALKIFEEGKYDLILMDICMPVMDGIQTFKALKQAYPKTLPPVVALTASAGEDQADEYLKLGMSDFVSKPITKDKIYQILINHLNQVP